MITRPEIMEGIRRHIQPIGGQENLNILEVEPGHVRLSIELTEACLNLYGNAREFDTSKLKRILQSLETGLFFCQIFVFII